MKVPLQALVAVALLLAAQVLGLAHAQGTMVRVHTNQGPIDIRLLDAEAHKTVANFLSYVRSGAYASTVVHRSVPGFVVQLGGFAVAATGQLPHIPVKAPVANEFSASRSNVRGTVAMAKLGTDPNSATSEWFVNLANNAGSSPGGLDFQNGGFAVFGRVTGPGMGVVDKIAAFQTFDATLSQYRGTLADLGTAFTDVPFTDRNATVGTVREFLVKISAVTEFPPSASQTASDRIFNYLEAAFPQYLSPSAGTPGTFEGYSFRFYGTSNTYLATKDGQTWVLAPAVSPGLIALGPMADWLAAAQAAGY